jgi:hypothetical protein
LDLYNGAANGDTIPVGRVFGYIGMRGAAIALHLHFETRVTSLGYQLAILTSIAWSILIRM